MRPGGADQPPGVCGGYINFNTKDPTMSPHRATAWLSVFGLLVLSCCIAGDRPARADQPPEDQETVTSKSNGRTPAAGVNFRKQLGLPFASLSTLGSRIDASRRAHDPVALANAAHELAVAESVSGKKASVTSSALLKESAELAAMRRQEKELQAVLKVQQQLETAEDNIALLNNSINLAKQQIRSEQRAAAQDTEPGWGPRTVVLNNYTTQYLDLFVNGYYKGQVAPGMQQTFIIEHRWNPTTLTASGDEDIENFGPRYIWGKFQKYTWNVN